MVKSKEGAARIGRTLQEIGDASVQLTASEDKSYESVVVMDQDALEHLRTPLRNPGRGVPLARKNKEPFARVWERGIVSVVLEVIPQIRFCYTGQPTWMLTTAFFGQLAGASSEWHRKHRSAPAR